MPLLSIIVLSYNTCEMTLRCLSLLNQQYKKEIEEKTIEILLVDNNSSDTTLAQLAKEPSGKYIKVIKNSENLGFSKGNNAAVKIATGEFLLFLNSDTEVLDKGFLTMARLLKKSPKIGILGAGIKNSNGTIQPSAGGFYTLLPALLFILGFERLGAVRKVYTKKTSVDWVSGACMMISRKLFITLDGFDPEIFMYMEDMELCFRVKKAGYEIVIDPETWITHATHGSSNRSFAIIQIYKGLLLFYRKHQSHLSYMTLKVFLRLKAGILLFSGRVFHNTYLSTTYEKALEISR